MSKLMISADMEGIAGISSWSQCLPNGAKPRDYAVGRDLMNLEVLHVAKAFLKYFDEIIVVDAHNDSRNLDPYTFEGLPISLVQGNLFEMTMVPDLGCDALVLLGCHSSVDSKLHNVFSHTISRTFINGLVYRHGREKYRLGETGLNLLAAASYGTPTIMVSGDNASIFEIDRIADKGTARVMTKVAHHGDDLHLVPPEMIFDVVTSEADRAGKAFVDGWRPRLFPSVQLLSESIPEDSSPEQIIEASQAIERTTMNYDPAPQEEMDERHPDPCRPDSPCVIEWSIPDNHLLLGKPLLRYMLDHNRHILKATLCERDRKVSLWARSVMDVYGSLCHTIANYEHEILPELRHGSIITPSVSAASGF